MSWRPVRTCLRPVHDEIAEDHDRAGLEALQSPPFDQVVSEPAEPKAGLVVAKTRSDDIAAQRGVGKTRRVGVAVFQAEIDHAADGQGIQVANAPIHCRWHQLGQHIQGRQCDRVGHQRQIDELLDRAASEPGPRPFVLGSRFLFGRIRRPLHAQMAEVAEPDVDRPVARAQRRVQIQPQAGDGRLIDGRDGAGGEHRQARLRGRQCAGQELAFGPLQLQREHDRRRSLPAILRQRAHRRPDSRGPRRRPSRLWRVCPRSG